MMTMKALRVQMKSLQKKSKYMIYLMYICLIMLKRYLTEEIPILFYRNKAERFESENEEEKETAQEKRIRLAKKYIKEIEEKGK